MLAGYHAQRAAQILGERRAKIEGLACHWVIEREPGRVEEVALGRKSGHTTSSAPSIHVIAHDRMADRREMNADLMSPSGMEMGTKKVPRIEPSKACDVGLGRPTLIDDCHALPVSWIASYRLVDREVIGRQVSPRHHGVPPGHPPGGDRAAQKPVRAVGFRHDYEPGGLFIQPVDHPCPLGLPFLRQGTSPPEESVHQRPAPVSRRRVDDHPGWLVDYEKGIVLVNDGDWDVLARDGALLDRRDLDSDDLPFLGPVARLLAASIDENVTLSNQGRGLGA